MTASRCNVPSMSIAATRWTICRRPSCAPARGSPGSGWTGSPARPISCASTASSPRTDRAKACRACGSRASLAQRQSVDLLLQGLFHLFDFVVAVEKLIRLLRQTLVALDGAFLRGDNFVVVGGRPHVLRQHGRAVDRHAAAAQFLDHLELLVDRLLL